MRKHHALVAITAWLALSCLVGPLPAWAQGQGGQSASSPVCTTGEPSLAIQEGGAGAQFVPTLRVPRLIRFNGVVRGPDGQPRSGLVGMTFSIYQDQEGGATLWMETQNVALNALGYYTVLLGSERSGGVPLDLFASGEARWLGVKVELPGEVEQPRVLLVSVPYALKASDADTLGGKPASAFALAPGSEASTNSSTATPSVPGVVTPSTVGGSGTLNQIAKFTPDGMTLGNSAITEVNGSVGIGLSPPANQELVIGVPAGKLAMNMSNLADQDLVVNVTPPGAQDKVGSIGPTTATNLALQVGGAEKVRVTNAGNVGIGTLPPANQRLLIAVPPGAIAMNMSNLADQDLFVSISSPGAADKVGIIGPGQPTNLGLQVGGTEKVRITNAGNMGIGTKTPTQSLEVAGNTQIDTLGNGVIFQDGTVRTTALSNVVGPLSVTGTLALKMAGAGPTVQSGVNCSQIVLNAAGTGLASVAATCPTPAAAVALSPALGSFGTALISKPATPVVVTLTNLGAAPLSLSSNPSITGANAADFSIGSTNCSTSTALITGQNCTVTVNFTPSLGVTEGAALRFADNAAPGVQTVALTGAGAHWVELQGKNSTTMGVMSYNVYRGTASGSEGNSVAFTCTTLQAVPTTCIDTNVVAGTTYFYEITAVLMGVESFRSNEAAAKIPAP